MLHEIFGICIHYKIIHCLSKKKNKYNQSPAFFLASLSGASLVARDWRRINPECRAGETAATKTNLNCQIYGISYCFLCMSNKHSKSLRRKLRGGLQLSGLPPYYWAWICFDSLQCPCEYLVPTTLHPIWVRYVVAIYLSRRYCFAGQLVCLQFKGYLVMSPELQSKEGRDKMANT